MGVFMAPGAFFKAKGRHQETTAPSTGTKDAPAEGAMEHKRLLWRNIFAKNARGGARRPSIDQERNILFYGVVFYG